MYKMTLSIISGLIVTLCFQIILNLCGVIIVILLIDITLLIPITAALMIFYILRIIYIRTTSAIKRLEGISKDI